MNKKRVLIFLLALLPVLLLADSIYSTTKSQLKFALDTGNHNGKFRIDPGSGGFIKYVYYSGSYMDIVPYFSDDDVWAKLYVNVYKGSTLIYSKAHIGSAFFGYLDSIRVTENIADITIIGCKETLWGEEEVLGSFKIRLIKDSIGANVSVTTDSGDLRTWKSKNIIFNATPSDPLSNSGTYSGIGVSVGDQGSAPFNWAYFKYLWVRPPAVLHAVDVVPQYVYQQVHGQHNFGAALPYIHSLEGDHTVYFRAADKFHTLGPAVSFRVFLDKTAPVINSITPSTTAWTKSDVILTINGSDPVPAGVNAVSGVLKYQFSTDKSNWYDVSGNHLPVSTNDTYYFRAIDNAGNESPIVPVEIDNFDYDKPTSPSLTVTPTTLTNGNVVVTATSTDVGSGIQLYQYSNNGGFTWYTCGGTGKNQATITANGTYLFKAVDNLNNPSDSSTEIKITNIDKTIPVVTINDSFNSAVWYNTESLSISVTATDNLAGVDKVETKIDTGSYSDWKVFDSAVLNTGTLSYGPVLSGIHTYYFRAKDALDHYSYEESITIKYDNAAPLLSSSNTGGWSSSGSFTFTASDAVSGVNADSWSVTGVTGTITSKSATGMTYSITSEGDNLSGTVTVKDNAGNEATETVTFKVDKTAPTISVTQTLIKDDITKRPTHMEVAASKNVETGSGIDPASWKYAIKTNPPTGYDGSSDTSLSWKTGTSANLTSSDSYAVVFQVKDLAGNTGYATKNVTVDLTGPTISTVTHPQGWKADSVSVTATVSDTKGIDEDSITAYVKESATKFVSITTSKAKNSDGSYNVTATIDDLSKFANANGLYSIYISAADTLGNRSESSAHAVKVDTTAPTITNITVKDNDDNILTITGGQVALTNSATVNITAIVSDPQGSGSGSGVVLQKYYIGNEIGGKFFTNGQNIEITAAGTTTLKLYALDDVGKYHSETLTIHIDRTAPTVTGGSVADYVNSSLPVLSIPGVEDNVKDFTHYTDKELRGLFEYSFNNTDWQSLNGGNAVSITSLSAGNRSIYFRIADDAGNYGSLAAPLTFYVDRTGPSITDVVISCEGKVLSATDFANEKNISLSITGSDDSTGTISYDYVKSTAPLTNPSFSGYTFGSSIDIGGLVTGVNYIYLKAKDEAGNPQSGFTSLVVKVDDGSPGDVAISSTTHQAALEKKDAVSSTDGEFSFEPPATGSAGIKEYTWQLMTGLTKETATLVSIDGKSRNGTTTTPNISITNLADNPEESPFYFLQVKAIGGNNKASTFWSTYQFRVDTDPPRELRIESSSHANPASYYSSEMAVFEWNRPLDFSGVKSFYYIIQETAINWSAISSAADLSASWVSTDKKELSINLKDTFKTTKGTFYFAVIAEDYAGNIQTDDISVQFDGEKPAVSFDSISANPALQKIDISWSGLSDNSGISKINIELAKLVNGKPVPVANPYYSIAASGTYTVDGLDSDPGIVYVATITASDQAGNEYPVNKGINFNNQIVEVAVPFSEKLKGFAVEGESAAGGNTALLSLPVSLDIRVNNEALTALELENVVVESGAFVSGSAPSITYTLNFKDYAFTGQGLTFSADKGLVFNSLSYVEEIAENVQKTFTYTNVPVTGPPLLLFEYSALEEKDNNGNPVTFTFTGDIWDFNGVSQTAFSGSSWYLENGYIDLTATGLDGVYRLDASGNKVYTLPVSSVSVSPEREILGGRISENFIIEKEGVFYTVTNALLRDDRIVIIEADVAFSSAYITDTLTLKNFSLTNEGILVDESDFSFEAFTFTKDEILYSANSFDFVSNRLVITNGSASISQDKTFTFSSLVLTDEGADFSVAATEDFTNTYSGYTVVSESVLLGDGILRLQNAVIEIPSIFSGQKEYVTLHGLTVDIKTYGIVSAGIGSTSINLASMQGAYGDSTNINELTLTAEGLYASDVTLDAPSQLGSETWTFTTLLLGADGSIGASAPVEMNDFQIGSFTGLTARGITFNGKEISVASIEVPLSYEYTPSTPVFNSLVAKQSGITSAADFAEDSMWVNKDGWSFVLESVSLGANGLKGTSTVFLPAAYGSRRIVFPDFSIFSDSSYDTGSAADSFYIRLHGWKIKARGISLSGREITVAEGDIRLYSSMGGDTFTIPELVLDSSGALISSGQGTKPTNFITDNGYRVEASSYRFTESGLYITGDVLLPNALGSVGVPFTDTIHLTSRGSITTPVYAEPLTYTLAGWNIKAEEISFTESGIHIERNKVDLWGSGVILSFGSIDYYPNGEISLGGETFKPFAFNLLDSGMSVGMTRLWLSEEGISANAFVGLPPDFATEYIYFEKLTLHSGGYITSDVAIPEFHFKKLGMDFLFRNIRLGEEGFSIGEGVITLPESLESKKIRLTNFQIKKDGSFSLGGIGVDPFQLWGYTFYLDNLGFDGDAVSFEGGVRFPEDFIVEPLANKRIDISQFKISLTGEVLAFEVSSKEEFTFKLFDSWDLTVQEFSLTTEKLIINRAELHLPEEFNADAVFVSGVTVGIQTGEFDIGELGVTGVSLEFAGLTFNVSKVAISEDQGVVLTGGTVTIPDTYPDGISGVLLIQKFQIKPDFTVGDVIVTKPNVNASLFDGLFTLQDGSFGLSNSAEGFYLTVGGDIILGDQFPTGVGGKEISIHAFKINTQTGEIAELDASTSGLSFDLFGVTTFDQSQIGEIRLAKDTATGNLVLSLSGDLILSESFPEAIAGERVRIESFKIRDTGVIDEFSASLNLNGSREIFDGISLINGKVGAAIGGDKKSVVFSLGGSLELGDTFPQGIAGTKATISTFKMDTYGRILDMDISVALSDNLSIFDQLKIKKGLINFTKYGDKDILTKLSGSIILPDTLPEGFAGLSIDIDNFSFLSDGTIKDINFGISDLELDLFAGLKLDNGAFTVRDNKAVKNELLFSVSGDIILPSSLPAGLGGKTFSILRLDFTSGGKLTAFDAKMEAGTRIDLFAGMAFTFDTFAISLDGLGLSGSIHLPDTMPKGLPKSISLNSFAMGWNGEIKEISAGINEAKIEIAGFTADIKDFIIHKDHISLGSCIVTLPPNMGSQQLGVANAGFDYSGKFYGDIVVSDIRMDFAGFEVVLYSPEIKPDELEIGFSKATCKAPEFVGGVEIELTGVKLNPQGIQLSGVSFGIPDFTLPGGLGFKDVGVAFTFEGANYFVKGGGKMMVPGLGTMGAEVSFVNPGPVYPIGLKRAYFEFYASGPGIALASTGLFLNGIRGGLAFGPPDELPEEVRPMFGNGTRLQVGLRLVDGTGGSGLKGDMDVWVDITNWGWVFKGQVSVLSGFVNSQIIAAMTGKTFYGKVQVEIIFARGQVEIWVFDKNGKTKVSGAGSLEFGIPPEAVLGVWPEKTIWLAKVGAEFGSFTNGDEGFKAYAELPVLGVTGIYVPRNGDIVLGDVKEYVLYTPFSTRALSFRNMSAVAGGVHQTGFAGVPTRVVALDRQSAKPVKDEWYFDVSHTAPAAGEALSFRTASQDVQVEGYESIKRLVFFIEYGEGDPVITAISPTGLVYTPESADEVLRGDDHLLMAIDTSEVGQWKIEIDNLLPTQEYKIVPFGVGRVADMTVTTPSFTGQMVTDTIEITGSTDEYKAGSAVDVYISQTSDSYVGAHVGSGVIEADGSFSVTADVRDILDGEYYVFVSLDCGDSPAVRKYAPGSLRVVHYEEQLGAVEDFIAAEDTEGDIEISFIHPQEGRVKGYRLYVNYFTRSREEIIFLGDIKNTTLPGVEAGEEVGLSVAPIDFNGKEGLLSDEVVVTLGNDHAVVNDFTLSRNTIEMNLLVSRVHEGSFDITTLAPQVTGSAQDFVKIEILDAPEKITPAFADTIIDISSGSAQIDYSLYIAGDGSAGDFEVSARISNMANPELNETVTFAIIAEYPPITIEEISPDSWHKTDEAALTIKGANFLPGTRVYFEDTELVIDTLDKAYITTTVPAQETGGVFKVTVIGPDGLEVTHSAMVFEPSYKVIGYKTKTVIAAGDSGTFYYAIEGEHGFERSVVFTPQNVPQGWDVFVEPADAEGSAAGVVVQVPVSAALGVYSFSIIDDEVNVLPLDVEVVASYPAPVVASLSERAAMPGEEIEIYGHSFGDGAGQVMIGSVSQYVTLWENDRIKFIVSDGSVSGGLTVVRGGEISNSIEFYVKESGFSLYPSKTEAALQPGESIDISVQVAGYTEWVDLSAETNQELLTAELDKTGIKPNGSVGLTITVLEGLENGRYPVVITGRSGDIEISREITIILGEAFMFVTETLPRGMEGVTYSTWVETSFGEEPVSYDLTGGRLPAGVLLQNNGRVYGKPMQPGVYRVTITARDRQGRSIAQDYTLYIEENNWSHGDKDGGNTRFNSVPSPAGEFTKWTSSIVDGAKEILTGDGKVFVLGENKITGLDKTSGITVFAINGVYSKAVYVSRNLLVLTTGGELKVYETDLGKLRYSRSGVETFTTDGTNVYLGENRRISILNVAEGILSGVINAEMSADYEYLWQNGSLLRKEDTGVSILGDSGWVSVAGDAGSILADVSADEDSLVLLYENGHITAIHGDGNTSALDTMVYDGTIVLGEERIIVSGSGEAVVIDREDFTELDRGSVGFGGIAGAKEKFFIAGEAGFEARNGYDTSIIWSLEGSYLDTAIAGEDLFVLAGRGVVTAYSGPDNLYPPTTEVVIYPAQPDGENGFYLVNPLIQLPVDDPETYVAETWYQYDDTEWTLYDAAFNLPEGIYSFVTYSIDSGESRENDVIRNYQIDITDPVTEFSQVSVPGEKGFTVSTMELTLEASDGTSGVDKVFYTLNGEDKVYFFPVAIEEEGNYTFTYHAKDRAGNYEEPRSVEYFVDLYKPTAEAVYYLDDELGIVYLSAEDSYSGVERIEYRVNGGDIVTYVDPVALPIGGIYDVAYRAKDNAGWFSPWRNIVIDISNEKPVDLIQDVKYSWWSHSRYVNRDAQLGDRIYSPSSTKYNAIQALPEYLVGAEMIVSNFRDKHAWEDPYITFTAGNVIDVYVMKHPGSNADYGGWTFIEHFDGFEPHIFFRSGADIYRKTFRTGDVVEIPGSAMWKQGGPNVVFATRNIAADLKIFSPNPSLDLVPLGSAWYASTPLTGETGREWFMRIPGVAGYEEWISLGTNFSGETGFPYVEEYAEVEFKVVVSLEDTNETVYQTRVYPLVNKAGLEIIAPVQGGQIKVGEPMPIEFVVRDLQGIVIEEKRSFSTVSVDSDSGVEWSVSGDASIEDGKIVANGNGTVTLSGTIIAAYETVVDTETGEVTTLVHEKTGVVTLNAVDEWQAEAFEFGLDLHGEYGLQDDGRYYGFTEDHSRRLGEYMTVDIPYGKWWSEDRTEGVYVALMDGAGYNYKVNDGRYKVTLEVGPVPRRAVQSVNIEGKGFVLGSERSHSEWVFTVEVEVDVTDSLLEISGTEGLGLISLDVRRMDETEPDVEDSVMKLDRRVVIINNKWWIWNPDHFKYNRPGPDDDRWDDQEDEDSGDDDSKGKGRGGR